MGLYDHVRVHDARFRCSEGHALRDFQSKDFGSTFGTVELCADGTIAIESGGHGESPKRPLVGCFAIYTTCEQCPAFVQPKTANVVGVWCEFELDIFDDLIQAIRLVSLPTAEFLVEEPKLENMVGCDGPMPYADAIKLQRLRRGR